MWTATNTTTYVIAHVLAGRLELLRDPLNDQILAFEEWDLAAAVAKLLAESGFVAARLSVAPEGEPLHVVRDEPEALAIVRLLASELRLHRRANLRASRN